MRVQREESGREIVLGGTPLARGGEATVYAVPGEPDLVAKVYHQPVPEHAARLAAMLAAPPIDVRAGTGHRAVAWPLERLLAADERGRVVGCLLPRVEDARLIAEVCNPHARLQAYPLFHYGCLLRTARNLAAAVRRLHERGYIIGDLNESNVLIDAHGLVTLVDADSFQIPGLDRLYRCRVGKAEYTPPELQGVRFEEVDRGPEHDAFALAVLVFQLLMQGLHPFAGLFHGDGEPPSVPQRIAAGHWPYARARWGPFGPLPYAPPWTVLPPSVQELFACCFEDGHNDPGCRPDAAAWQQALDAAEHLLRTCSANAQHCYPDGLDDCPWCVLARQQDRDPFPVADGVRARRARSGLAGAAGDAAAACPPAVLDPDDPLPPRPAPSGGEDTGRRRVDAVGGRRAGLAWIAAAAVGGLAGVLFALWAYREASALPGPAEGGVQRVESQRPPGQRNSTAERAWRLAVHQLQIARDRYQQHTGAYQQLMQDYRAGRVPAQTLQDRARALREEAVRLRELERVAKELARLRNG